MSRRSGGKFSFKIEIQTRPEVQSRHGEACGKKRKENSSEGTTMTQLLFPLWLMPRNHAGHVKLKRKETQYITFCCSGSALTRSRRQHEKSRSGNVTEVNQEAKIKMKLRNLLFKKRQALLWGEYVYVVFEFMLMPTFLFHFASLFLCGLSLRGSRYELLIYLFTCS